MVDLGKPLFQLLLGQGSRPGSPAWSHMTWFDGIDVPHLLFDQEVKKMSEGVQPPIDCCGSSSLVVLCIDEPINLTK
jgi:hypothetical protein